MIKPYYEHAGITIYHGDCFEIMPELPQVDLVLTDPPYGFGLFEHDKAFDVELFTMIVKEGLSQNGFFALFSQMPHMAKWHTEITKKFHYLEHVSWVKRMAMPSRRLSRSHESILIYGGSNNKFYETKGLYEDVKVPGVMFDVVAIQSIQRHVSSLYRKLKHGADKMRKTEKQQKVYTRYKAIKSNLGDRSPREVNFTNVWSFLPDNLKSKKNNGHKLSHPTQKPIAVMKRLTMLLSKHPAIALDPFMGSGTTLVAAKELGRRAIGIEVEEKYVKIAIKRLEQEVLPFS
jgi:site-specific DNA-methyltransferase (adenine-specific)